MREALIDVGAIARNVELLKATVDGMPSMVVVKANGYGHGAIESARAALAGGADWLGVVDLAEAMELREAGIDAPVLAWLHDTHAEFGGAIGAAIDIGVSQLEQLEQVAAAGRANVHLKVDTGLGRNGAAPADWAEYFARAAELQRTGRIAVRGLWSHLAGADDDVQVESFTAALAAASSVGLDPEFVHLAASSAALGLPRARFGMVRFGIAAYGLAPTGDPVSTTPAMTLSGSVVSAKRVAAGTGVSYGHDYVTARETTLALVPLGYADGIPRHASGRAPVSINGTTYRIAGRVAMDQFVVDVGDDAVSVGDRAVLFGDPSIGVPSADDWAAASGTINYEIVTRIGPRVTRRYIP